MKFLNRDSVLDYITNNKNEFVQLDRPSQLETIDELIIACGRFELDTKIIEELTSGGLIDMKVTELDKEELQKMLSEKIENRESLTEAVNKAQATILEKDGEITKLTQSNTELSTNLEAARNTIKEVEDKLSKANQSVEVLQNKVAEFEAKIKLDTRISELVKANIDTEKLDVEQKKLISTCDDSTFANFISMFSLKKEDSKPTEKPKEELANASIDMKIVNEDTDKDKQTDTVDMSFVRKGFRNTWK